MMRALILVSLATFSLMGCANITSAAPTAKNVNGDAWYVKETGLPGGLVFAADIYYCPEPNGPQAVCHQAKIVEQGAAAPASSANYGTGASAAVSPSGQPYPQAQPAAQTQPAAQPQGVSPTGQPYPTQ